MTQTSYGICSHTMNSSFCCSFVSFPFGLWLVTHLHMPFLHSDEAALLARPLLSFPIVLPAVSLPFVGKVYVFEKIGKMRKMVGPSWNVSEKGRVVLDWEKISYQLAVPLLPWKESCQENPALFLQRSGGLPLPCQVTSLKKRSDALWKISFYYDT